MLEPLVSSKVRRKVLEHLLAHPERRFYLRGLARELGLTVSPVHRELKRLERFGVLKTFHEANVCFYVTDETCPLLAQWSPTPLLSCESKKGGGTCDHAPMGATSRPPAGLGTSMPPTAEDRGAIAGLKQAGPRDPAIGPALHQSGAGPWPESTSDLPAASPVQARFFWSTLVGVLSLGIALGVGIVSALTLANRQLLALTKTSAFTSRLQAISQLPAAYGAREMRSARLRLVPGMVGGFNPPGLSGESY
ncbi:MAG: winged helix-turn-helix domain-containing protein [Candidatus Omnitrophota bacterium]|nr:winged helix-turn-helix domain-containing protein [Candidatus Omnitrophota bacterium]